MTDDRLAEIKATLHYWDAMYAGHGLAPLPPAVAAQESGRHVNRAELDWLVGEVERLRVVAGEASPREILGLPDEPPPASEHAWIEVSDLGTLPERVWMCNAHPGEWRRQEQWRPPPAPMDPPNQSPQ